MSTQAACVFLTVLLTVLELQTRIASKAQGFTLTTNKVRQDLKPIQRNHAIILGTLSILLPCRLVQAFSLVSFDVISVDLWCNWLFRGHRTQSGRRRQPACYMHSHEEKKKDLWGRSQCSATTIKVMKWTHRYTKNIHLSSSTNTFAPFGSRVARLTIVNYTDYWGALNDDLKSHERSTFGANVTRQTAQRNILRLPTSVNYCLKREEIPGGR